MKTLQSRYAFLICTLLSLSAYAQSYIGYATDNFSGVHGGMANPATMADSRTYLDVTLLSADGLLANDYFSIGVENINDLFDGANYEDFDSSPSDQNNVLLNLDAVGPSFMLSLNEKHSIGLISRVRVASNLDNINGELIEGILNDDGFIGPSFSFDQQNLDITLHGWAEIGASYARVLWTDERNHFLKGGLTLKYLMGAGIMQSHSDRLYGQYSETAELMDLDGDLTYLISYEDEDGETVFDSFKEDLTPGFGADIGFVYEFRSPRSAPNATHIAERSLNQYLLKVGVAVLDIGSITYKDLEATTYAVNGVVTAAEFAEDPIEAIERVSTEQREIGDYKINLPTSLRVQLDYKISDYFYANLEMNQSLVSKDKPFNNSSLNRITFTPRFEMRHLGAYLPLTYSSLSKTSIGLGLKLGPVFLGSSTIISNLISNSSYMADVYVGFKIPIQYKKY